MTLSSRPHAMGRSAEPGRVATFLCPRGLSLLRIHAPATFALPCAAQDNVGRRNTCLPALLTYRTEAQKKPRCGAFFAATNECSDGLALDLGETPEAQHA